MTAKRATIKVEIADTEKECMKEVLDGILDLLDDMKDSDTMFFKERNDTYATAYFDKEDIQSFADFLTYCIGNPAVLE